MSQIVACNSLLQFKLTQELDIVWNATTPNPRYWRLFTALAGTGSCGHLHSDFTEASYPGYSAIPLLGLFGPVTKVQDCQYQIATAQQVFSTSGAGPYSILGYYFDDGFPNLWLYELFDAPFMLSNSNPLTLQVKINEWSRSFLP